MFEGVDERRRALRSQRLKAGVGKSSIGAGEFAIIACSRAQSVTAEPIPDAVAGPRSAGVRAAAQPPIRLMPIVIDAAKGAFCGSGIGRTLDQVHVEPHRIAIAENLIGIIEVNARG